jgi:hypothetical protein
MQRKSRRALHRRLLLATAGSVSGAIASDRHPGHESKPAKSRSRCRASPRNISARTLSEQLRSDSILDQREGLI